MQVPAALAAGFCAACILLTTAPTAGAHSVTPKSAPAFRDSVGVVTHAVYYDTSYGNWPKVVASLRKLGVTHLRDGLYANESPEWRDWTERYYRAVDLAGANGMRFDFGMGRPGAQIGTIDQLVAVASGRLRNAVEALEAPNEFDKYVGGRGWASRLADYDQALYRKVKSVPNLRYLPFVGPSFSTVQASKLAGSQRSSMDFGNVHPYTGGRSPDPAHLKVELGRARAVSGRKPVWATEAGFHNALRARSGQPGVSERVAAVYLLRTFLEHFRSGISRTYAYELVDEKPERAGRNPEQHFGLMRNDFTPKPAYTALRNLLKVVGPNGGAPRLRPLRLGVSGPAHARSMVLQRADGTYVVALWRLASAWNTDRGRAIRVAPRGVNITLPGTSGVRVVDPVASSGGWKVRLRHGHIRLRLGDRPLLLTVAPKGAAAARKG
jgi:hypothetical protein